jgi:hypothetical protein
MGSRGLKQVIIQAGDVVRVHKVMRGALLGSNEPEWTRRAKVEQRVHERYFILMGVLYFAVSVPWIVFILQLEIDLLSSELFFPLMWGIVGSTYLLGYYFLKKQNDNPPAVPGLYEFGIQLPSHWFIPYPEIGKIERKNKRLNSYKKRDIIRLRSKFAKKPGSLTDGWAVSADFLGTGGMVELKNRLEMDRGIKTSPPPLVIYGRGGAKAETKGMGPIRGAW